MGELAAPLQDSDLVDWEAISLEEEEEEEKRRTATAEARAPRTAAAEKIHKSLETMAGRFWREWILPLS